MSLSQKKTVVDYLPNDSERQTKKKNIDSVSFETYFSLSASSLFRPGKTNQ